MKKTILTVQHTESQHHVNGMIGAWGDWELTQKGRAQAMKIGEWLLKEEKMNDYHMYVSDLKRAVQTAKEMNKSLQLTPEYRKDIREVNAGEGNGKPAEWYKENRIPRPDIYNPDYRSFEDAESDRDLWNRLYPFYEEITSNSYEKIIIVSHGTALSFLHSMLFKDGFEHIRERRFKGSSGAVSKFIIESDGKVIIKYINHMV